MSNSGKNGFDVRTINRSEILKLVNKQPGISRKEIANRLHLTPAAISNITSELIKEETLIEYGVRSNDSKSGRKEVLLCLNKSHYRVLCAYIATRSVDVFCMDLDEKLLFQRNLNFKEEDSGRKMLERICDVFDEYLETLTDQEKQTIIGIGMAVKGIVDSKAGISKRSFGLWEDELNIKEIVQSRMHYQVIINNNVKCVAYAEHLLSGGSDKENMIFIKYGPLIGGAFISDSEIYDGQDYQTMNLGHIIADINGDICRCGRRGCLETIVGFDVMAKLLEIQYSPTILPILYRLTNGDKTKIDMETILKCYDFGEKNVVRIVNRAMEYLALIIVNLISTINPQKIVFYGRPFESQAFTNELLEKIREKAADSNATDMSISIRNMDLDFVGCASIVIKDFLESGAVLKH